MEPRELLERARLRSERGELHLALADCDEAIRLDPSGAAYNTRGAVRAELGDHRGAVSDLTRALELDPRCVSALFNRARSRQLLEDAAGAQADYQLAVHTEPHPNDPHGFLARGKARYKLRDFRGAAQDFTRAIEIDPCFAHPYRCRGLVFEETGKRKEAIADYSEAIRLAPNDPDTYFGRAEMHLAVGNPQGALSDAKRALEVAAQDWPYRRRAIEFINDLGWRA